MQHAQEADLVKKLGLFRDCRLVFDQAHDGEGLQAGQLGGNRMAGGEEGGGHGLGVHARANAGSGAGVEQADVPGMQVFGEEEFIDQAVEEAFVVGAAGASLCCRRQPCC